MNTTRLFSFLYFQQSKGGRAQCVRGVGCLRYHDTPLSRETDDNLGRVGQRDVTDPGGEEPDERGGADGEGELRGQSDAPSDQLQLLSALSSGGLEDEDSGETSSGQERAPGGVQGEGEEGSQHQADQSLQGAERVPAEVSRPEHLQQRLQCQQRLSGGGRQKLESFIVLLTLFLSNKTFKT